MQLSQIGNWIDHPDEMGADAVELLPQLISQYPYCASFRMLYAIALANTHSTGLSTSLNTAAAALPDRTKLFRSVNKGEHDWVTLLLQLEQGQKKQFDPAEEPDAFSLVEKFLDGRQDADGETADLPSGLSYSLETLASMPDYDPILDGDEMADDTTGQDAEADQLIDRFLNDYGENGQASSQHEGATSEIPTPEPGKISEKAFLTESLAKLYIKQGKFEQALEIFSSLNLKYPNKSRNFADQIRYLEKVIASRKDYESSDSK